MNSKISNCMVCQKETKNKTYCSKICQNFHYKSRFSGIKNPNYKHGPILKYCIDCGMDGLYGTSCEGHDVEKCIGTVVESVLRYRKRYGGSHRVDLTPEVINTDVDVHIKSDSNFRDFIQKEKEKG